MNSNKLIFLLSDSLSVADKTDCPNFDLLYLYIVWFY